MKKIIILIFIIFTLSCATDYIDHVVTVPLYSEFGLTYTDVEVGDKSYRFILDTGASLCIIDQKLPLENYLTKVGKTVANGDFETDVYKADITVGEVNNSKSWTVLYDFENNFQVGFNIDGILGLSYFDYHTFSIDHIRNELLMCDNINKLFDHYKKDFNRIEYNTSEGGNIFIDIEIDGETYSALIDSGANKSSAPKTFTREYSKEYPDRVFKAKKIEERTTFTIGDIGQDESSDQLLVNLKELNIDDIELTDIEFRSHNRNYFVLGNDFLKNFTIIIDPLFSDLYLYKESNTFKLKLLMEGISFFEFENEKGFPELKINSVVINSLPWNSGLRPGMKVVRVNSIIPSEYKSKNELFSKVFSIDKVESLDIIDNNGELKTISLAEGKE